MHIEIIGKDLAQHPELPSHFFPGCGSGTGVFKLVGAVNATREEIANVIESAIIDPVQVNSFEPITGVGSFAVIDGEAPEIGTIIQWPPTQIANEV